MDLDENNDEIVKIKQVKEKVKEELMTKFSNVTGVGVGYRILKGERTNQICIRVYVEKKLPLAELQTNEILPTEIEGIRIDVIEGSFTIQSDPTKKRDPLIGALSIINSRMNAAGTLGGTVFDNTTRSDMILSNWHVLCGNGCQVGDTIIQPGSYDGGTNQDAVATLTRSTLSSHVDAGIAVLNGKRFLDQSVLGLGWFKGHSNPSLGLQVRKSGRTTGITTGQITDLSADVTISGYPGGSRRFSDQLLIEASSGLFSDHGDSGSLVLNDNNQVIGLLFAGGGTLTIANKISNVISELNIDIDLGITLHDLYASIFLNLL